jgi:alkaline phosphatase D
MASVRAGALFRAESLGASAFARFRALGVAALALFAAVPLRAENELRIAFGSCSEHDKAQPVWDAIRAAEPAAFVWIGDAVYGDTEDMSVLRAKYAAQLAQPGYAALRAAVPIFGSWDDHDYGVNVGNRHYPKRAESQQIFLDFLGVRPADPRRRREGVYTSHELLAGDLRVKLVLLDVRYHRDPVERPDSAMLGEEQWHWLASELADESLGLAIVFSGTQVLPDEHLGEKWADYPAEQQRLYETLGRAPIPVLLASGDRHFGELSCDSFSAARRPLYEITSSGLNRHSDAEREPNRRRIGEAWSSENFGMIRVDPGAGRVTLEIRDVEGRVRSEREIPLAAMRPRDGRARTLAWASSLGCGAKLDLPAPIAARAPDLALGALGITGGGLIAAVLMRRRWS